MRRTARFLGNKGFFFFWMPIALVAILFAGCGKKDLPAASTPEQPEELQKVASDRFEAPGMCQYCHLEIYQQWAGSMHAYSAVNQVYLAEAARASLESGGNSDLFCASCHAPVGVMAGEIPPVDGSNLSDTARRGVSCDLCHTITEITGIGNTSFRVTPGKTKYGPFADPIHTPLHESKYLDIYTNSKFCGACHDIIHPENGLALAATYSEWKESPFASRGIQCQDCHMTPGAGVTRPNPGYAATGAPKKREHTWTHYMVGGNVFTLRQSGSEEHARQAEENLKSAATLFLGLPESLRPYQPATVNVRIRNGGAGHYLPTGLSVYKEMWLEITARDQQGRLVWQSGVLDGTGRIPAGSTVFKKVLADAGGRETTSLWQAAAVLADRRIPPQKYVDEFFELPGLPQPGTLHVQARLLYRSMTAERAVELGIGIMDIPVVEMARITGEIPVR